MASIVLKMLTENSNQSNTLFFLAGAINENTRVIHFTRSLLDNHLATQFLLKKAQWLCLKLSGEGPTVGTLKNNLICMDFFMSDSAVKVSNCQYYRVLTVEQQRGKHMEAQLVEACLLNPTPSYTDFLI